MKILVVGASGTIGQSVVKELSLRHEVITAGQSSGDIRFNMEDIDSIKKMYQEVKALDAVAVAAGRAQFGMITEMTQEKYMIGIRGKLMGQVNLVLEGIKHLNDKGSFTLITGILNREPILSASNSAMVNGAIDAFVKAAAIELPRGLRINSVSPTVLAESMDNYGPYFRGYKPVAANEVGLAYSKSIEGAHTGQVYIVG